MTQHTSELWEYRDGAIYKGNIAIGHADRNDPRTTPTERDANTQLMAAAPTLLAAAKDCYWLISEEQMFKVRPELVRALERIVSAIKKAEGK